MDLVKCFIDYIYGWRKYNYYVETMIAKYLSYKLLGGIWWNNIDDKIVLGAIPLHNLGHLEEFKKENIGAVLSLLEDFEMQPTLHYFKPINEQDWINNGVNFLQVRTRDSYGVDSDGMKECIGYILDNIGHGRKVYVHCKAGRGRSASVVLCYLLHNLYMKEGRITADDIKKTYEYLKKLRTEIDINETQFRPIYEYVISLLHKPIE